jgi:hypothetical protein
MKLFMRGPSQIGGACQSASAHVQPAVQYDMKSPEQPFHDANRLPRRGRRERRHRRVTWGDVAQSCGRRHEGLSRGRVRPRHPQAPKASGAPAHARGRRPRELPAVAWRPAPTWVGTAGSSNAPWPG